MATKEFWNNLSEIGYRKMVEDWLAANRETNEKEEYEPAKVDLAVVDMCFSHVHEKLWDFILLTLSMAQTEHQLEKIGIGLIEFLLGWYGDSYIDNVEEQVITNKNFRQALLPINKYMMSDKVWTKVQVLQENIRSKQFPIANV